MTQADSRSRSVAIGLFSIATLVAWVLTASGSDGWVPFSAWIVSMTAACIAVPGGQRAARPSRLDWWALVFVTLLAAGVRLYQLDAIPNGLWIGEIWTAQNSAALARRHEFAPFGTTLLSPLDPNQDRQCNLYLYFAWLVQAAFGSGRTGVKMISVLPGILAVPLLYALARTFLARNASLAAAGLFAASIWHVTLSRWGWAQVLSTTLFVLVAFFVQRGIRAGSQRSLLLAGIASGLALYTYLASRIGVAAVLAFLCLHLFQGRGQRRTGFLLLYLAGLCLAGFPVFVTWLHDPAFFWGRMTNVSILPVVLSGDMGGLLRNIASHLLMFHWSGDMNPRHNLPGEPMLDPVGGIFFLAGLVVAFRSIKRAEFQLCLVWLFFGLLGGVLSSDTEAPQGYRTGFVAPACFLLAGAAVDALDAFVRKRLPGVARFSLLAVLLLVAASASIGFSKYFVERPASREAWYASLGGEARFVSDRVARRIAAGFDVYLDATYRNFIVEAELELLFREDPSGEANQRLHWIDVRKETIELSFLYDPAAKAVLFVLPVNLDILSGRVPGLRQEPLVNRFGDTLAISITGAPEAREQIP
jgi:hypothetical protein